MRAFAGAIAILLIAGLGAQSPAWSADPPGPKLKMVTIDGLSLGQVRKLAGMGLDIGAVRKGPVATGPRGVPFPSYRVEAVTSSRDRTSVSNRGYDRSM